MVPQICYTISFSSREEIKSGFHIPVFQLLTLRPCIRTVYIFLKNTPFQPCTTLICLTRLMCLTINHFQSAPNLLVSQLGYVHTNLKSQSFFKKNKATLRTSVMPGKTAPSQMSVSPSYVGFPWTLSRTWSVYVYANRNPLRLGKLVGMTYTTKWPASDASYKHVLKLQVEAKHNLNDSADEDSHVEVYGVEESKFSDFVDLCGGKWPLSKSNTIAMEAYTTAIAKDQLGKRGDWMKKIMKEEINQTQDESLGLHSDVSGTTNSTNNPDTNVFQTSAPPTTTTPASKRPVVAIEGTCIY